MNPAVEDEQLKDAGRFQRLDLMIATNLIEQFNKMRKHRNQPGHHAHPPADHSHGIQRPERRKAPDGTRDGESHLPLVLGEIGAGATSHFA
eukprot:4319920-Pyramimonas_sp.AAC.1